MEKLSILSIVLMSFIIPIRLCASPRPMHGLQRAQRLVLGFIVVWAFLCLHWYPRHVFVK